MTAYIITPEEHAQLLKALTTRDLRLHEKCEAMLKSMKPVEHIAELMWDEEKQKPYMQYTMPIGLLPEGSKLYAKEQQ